MFRQRVLQWMLPGVVLVGLGVAASAPADPENPRDLAKQRLKVAQEANDVINARSRTLENASSEQVRRWSRRLMEAEMGMSEKKVDQIAAINVYLSRMKEMEKRANMSFRNQEAGYLDTLDAQWYVLEAESLLSQAQAEHAAR